MFFKLGFPIKSTGQKKNKNKSTGQTQMTEEEKSIWNKFVWSRVRIISCDCSSGFILLARISFSFWSLRTSDSHICTVKCVCVNLWLFIKRAMMVGNRSVVKDDRTVVFVKQGLKWSGFESCRRRPCELNYCSSQVEDLNTDKSADVKTGTAATVQLLKQT